MPENEEVTIEADFLGTTSEVQELVNGMGVSADHAKIWAEGTDAQVQQLGGTHSSKGWTQTIQTNYVQKTGDIMTGDLIVQKSTEHFVASDTNLDRVATPEENINGGYFSIKDKNNNLFARMYASSNTSGQNSVALQIINGDGSGTASIGLSIPKSSTSASGFAPTPASNAGGNQIATAAWVRNLLGTNDANGLASYSFGTSKSYMKFKNGLLLQWGQHTITENTINGTITFLQAFANTNYVAVKNMNAIGNQGTTDQEVSLFNKTTTTMQFTQVYSDSPTFDWFAIGNWE